jgi:pimeloyl-ACP methyl ester carboxylesterase
VSSPDGVHIAYDLYGTEGPAVVLVHGWGNNRTFFDPHIQKLSQNHRVVTLDLAGYGESGDNRVTWTMEAFGQDVAAVVDALELDGAVLVGFSLGGAVVLEAAVSMGGDISGVVLVDVFQNVTQKVNPNAIEAWLNQLKTTWHTEEGFRVFLGSGAPDSLMQRLLEKTPPVPPDHWWKTIDEFYQWSDTDLIQTIQAVTVPIAAINAAVPPTDVEGFRAYAPSFQVTTIPDVGHLGVLWMKPDLFVESLEAFVRGMVGKE